MSIPLNKLTCSFFCLALIACGLGRCARAEGLSAKPAGSEKTPAIDQPVIVNGDTVEYVTERSEITAKGNVRVNYKGTKLTCNSLVVNTITKDGVAEGLVVIEDTENSMRGEKIIYNFNTKKGTVINGRAASPPGYFKADAVDLKGNNEFISKRGFTTTCSYDVPHYRLNSRTVRMLPGDKVQMYRNTFMVGALPFAYLPYYSQSLRDPIMHVQVVPGYRKEWGPFLLTAWRCNLTDSVDGRVYLDYRDRLGLAEGAGLNYRTPGIGKGDFKGYYPNERPKLESVGGPGEYERWLMRWGHQWDIDERTSFIADFYKIADEKRAEKGADYGILKDYFPKEYDEDSQPLSYAFVHHNFDYGSLDLQVQERPQKWYSQVERMPEVKYTLPSYRLTGDDSPVLLYYDDVTQAAYLKNLVASPAAAGAEYDVARFDTYNKISAPFKAGILDLTPFAAMRNTQYSAGEATNSINARTVYYAGSSVSTKFYRIYGVGDHFMHMDINEGIRHIVTPTVTYSYNTRPNVRSSQIRQFDSIDAIGERSYVDLGISNRLQTKRENVAVDFFDFRVSSAYNVYSEDPLTDVITRNRFSDSVLLDFEFLPYSWLSFVSDADYNRHRSYFETINHNVSFTIAEGRSFGIGQRYSHSGTNEITAGLDWMLTPKWTFHAYERYQVRDNVSLPPGLIRQEYGFTRDMHCWLWDFVYTSEKEHGQTLWFVFRLKAFPEAQVGLTQSYRSPKPGAVK